MLKEFKAFAMRGNVLDMAVGIIIGASFGKIISSFVADILMPPIGLLLGKVDFSNLFVTLSSSKSFSTLAEAKAAGVPTMNYGLFINTVIDFLIAFGMLERRQVLATDTLAEARPEFRLERSEREPLSIRRLVNRVARVR